MTSATARKKLLFLVAHRPGRSPGQRFRFEQYLQHLTDHGYDCHISHLISEHDDQPFYSRGHYLAKLRIVLHSFRRRLTDIRNAAGYDAVFVYREAYMLGITWFERQLRKKGVPLILDFDDSIWLNDTSNGNRHLAFLKRPSKVPRLIALSRLVLVGNDFLATYARGHNPNVQVVPTTIDTDYYVPAVPRQKDTVCIGWTGSRTTLRHLALALPVLRRLREQYGDKVCFRVISDEPFGEELPGLENIAWQPATEISDLQAIDIGIMPLPDDEWARGKCGFKGLQYMALEIPAVMSPVGVNNQIITDGVNGFLADTPEEWVQKLSQLIESPSLRRQLGSRGRQTVIERYSFQSQKKRYLELFNQVTGE